MKMKSFFARTVEEAVEQARREMGPEALLVNSRKAPPEARALGEYEVVFAVLPEDEPRANDVVRPAAKQSAAASPDPVTLELARLRKQVEEMGSALTGLKGHEAPANVPAPEFAEMCSRLIANDFSIEVAEVIVMQAHARLNAEPAAFSRRKMPLDGDAIERAVRAELEQRLSVDTNLDAPAEDARVVVLVGPPGCGKTTTAVKLAVRYGLASLRRVHLISADTRRVGAAEQLRTFAAIVGASFDAVDTPHALKQSIEAHRQKGLILVDTQGYGARDMDDAVEWARFFSNQPGMEVHLVAPASMRSADLTRVLDRFEIFSPSRLIFTHMDETLSYGGVISASVRTAKPISFLASGQEIPEDIELATAARLLGLVFDRPAVRAVSAA
jgi:flagellar biosynthesis protein FlhF